ncbi:hypothetical protein CEXT_459071 [Caerostris extrusa]|uniref:Uncharacterized protein n=1 Tax=Caerostris extrusa TaxID=172846 RepID=A0AAV4Y7G7_CAEEX|nr:hypothetical protein CEXT_459071 [Caerostris extrusa]
MLLWGPPPSFVMEKEHVPQFFSLKSSCECGHESSVLVCGIEAGNVRILKPYGSFKFRIKGSFLVGVFLSDALFDFDLIRPNNCKKSGQLNRFQITSTYEPLSEQLHDIKLIRFHNYRSRCSKEIEGCFLWGPPPSFVTKKKNMFRNIFLQSLLVCGE